MSRHVYIYNDEGASAESVDGWICMLKWTLRYPDSHIHTVKAEKIIEALQAHPPVNTALIVPGGADLPYLKLLGNVQIEKIRAVLAAGGCYIGVCAGAYFASSECIFEKENPVLRVVGPRPLCLFPHPAIGAVRENFCYGSEDGATVESLHCRWRARTFLADIYCNGGAAWDIESNERTTVIARYSDAVLKRHGIENGAPVAALKHTYGANGTVVLCGVHPELPHADEDKWDPESMELGRLLLIRSLAEAALLVGTDRRPDCSST